MLGVSSKRVLAENHLLTGEAYFEDKNFEAAKAEFELAIVIDPDYSAGWSNLAAACINLGELNDAIMHTIKAVELNEKNWMAAYNLAYALDDKEDYIQAIEWYTKAIEWNSTELLAYSALGRVYNLSKRPVEAILILKKANNYFPDSDSLYLIHKNLGYSYYLLGQIKESITFLKSSLESNPDEVETILYMAQSYEAASDITMCIESWQKYISLETDTLKVNNAKEHLQVITKQYLEKIIND